MPDQPKTPEKPGILDMSKQGLNTARTIASTIPFVGGVAVAGLGATETGVDLLKGKPSDAMKTIGATATDAVLSEVSGGLVGDAKAVGKAGQFLRNAAGSKKVIGAAVAARTLIPR